MDTANTMTVTIDAPVEEESSSERIIGVGIDGASSSADDDDDNDASNGSNKGILATSSQSNAHNINNHVKDQKECTTVVITVGRMMNTAKTTTAESSSSCCSMGANARRGPAGDDNKNNIMTGTPSTFVESKHSTLLDPNTKHVCNSVSESDDDDVVDEDEDNNDDDDNNSTLSQQSFDISIQEVHVCERELQRCTMLRQMDDGVVMEGLAVETTDADDDDGNQQQQQIKTHNEMNPGIVYDDVTTPASKARRGNAANIKNKVLERKQSIGSRDNSKSSTNSKSCSLSKSSKVNSEESIQPILLQIVTSASNSSPFTTTRLSLGIDISYSLPVITYIQPSSPLVGYVETGDVIVYVDGRSSADFSYADLMKMLNGGDVDGVNGAAYSCGVKAKSSGGGVNNVEEKGGTIVRRLVILPGKNSRRRRRRLYSSITALDNSSEAVEDGGAGSVNDKKVKEVERLNDGGDGKGATSSLEGVPVVVATSSETRLASDSSSTVASVLVGVDVLVRSDGAQHNTINNNNNSSLEIIPKKSGLMIDTKNHSIHPAIPSPPAISVYSINTTTVNPSLTINTNPAIVTPAATTIKQQISSNEKDAKQEITPRTASPSTTANTKTSFDDALEGLPAPPSLSSSASDGTTTQKKIGGDLTKQQVGDDQEEVIGSCKEENDAIAVEESSEQTQQREKVGETQKDPSAVQLDKPTPPFLNTVEQKEDGKPEEVILASVEQVQTPPPQQHYDLDEAEDFRKQRRNRPAPDIEVISVQNCTGGGANYDGEDISTIYGGTWNATLQSATMHRMEDNLGFMEEGRATALYDYNTASQLKLLGLNDSVSRSREAQARKQYYDKQDADVKEQLLKQLRKRHRMIEGFFVTLICVSIGALVVILATVLKKGG
jgi:hypothetical protein